MDVVIFPNARNVGVMPPTNILTSNLIQMTTKDMDNILKFHKKQKITNIIFRYGDPMDIGIEFFMHLLDKLDSDPKYEKTRVTIESPLISFLKRYGAWKNVIDHDRVLVKATFNYGEKESSGRFFSDSNLMDAYSRFWYSFHYRPVLIYYKSFDNTRYASHMERLALMLKTTLEVRDTTTSKDDWCKNEAFYLNDSYRYTTSHVWFDNNPSKYESNSEMEVHNIEKKRDEVATKLKERSEKAERQAEARRKEEERENAILKSIKVSKEIQELNKPKAVTKKKRTTTKPNSGFTKEQKEQLHIIRDKTVSKLNSEVSTKKHVKHHIDLYEAIEKFRATNNLG